MLKIANPIASTTIPNFRMVDDFFYAGGQPILPQGIQELVATGIYRIIKLNDQFHDEEMQISLDLGIKEMIYQPLPGIELFHELPMDKVNELINIVESSIEFRMPVYVHCEHGSDRTGAIVGCYRINHGSSVGDAIKEMRKFGDPWFGEWGMRDTIEDWFNKGFSNVK